MLVYDTAKSCKIIMQKLCVAYLHFYAYTNQSNKMPTERFPGMGNFPQKKKEKEKSIAISLQLSERLCLVCFCLSEAQKHMSNTNLSQCSRYKFAVNCISAMSALRISFTWSIIRYDVFFFCPFVWGYFLWQIYRCQINPILQ